MVAGVADATRNRRSALGLTAAEVSERTEAGKPLSRAVISDLETGRKRTLDIAELVTLATALELSPLSLLVPDVLTEIEVLPGRSVPGVDVIGWWSGAGGVTENQWRDLLGKDDGIQIALDLVRVEKALRLQRINLEHAERQHRLFEHDSERDRAETARARIELFEDERKRLLALYDGVIKGRSPDA